MTPLRYILVFDKGEPYQCDCFSDAVRYLDAIDLDGYAYTVASDGHTAEVLDMTKDVEEFRQAAAEEASHERYLRWLHAGVH